MNKFFYYNSLCTGSNTPSIFSIDPYVTAVKELLVSELKQVVYYIEKLRALDFDMAEYTDKVIEFIAVIIINLDFAKENTFIITEDLYNNKKMLEKMYISACSKNSIEPELFPEENGSLCSKDIILKALNDKEKHIKTGMKKIQISRTRKFLYEIMMNIVLNACNNLIELKNCGKNPEEAENKLLKFLNTANIPSLSDDEIKKAIMDFSESCYETQKLLYNTLIEKYGPVIKTEVKFCQKKGKAVLVSGSCSSELELILKAVNGLDINVYSYDKMINAFQYEKFKNNPAFAGHYYKNNSNMQSDFADFPGPVFISKNSLPKIDVIRGRIFTSAKYPSYGISKIENNNFEPLIKCALDSGGFKENKEFKTVKTGYNRDEIIKKTDEITSKYKNGEIKEIAVIGLIDRFNPAGAYTEDFIKTADEDIYIISFSCDFNRQNFMYVNFCFDFGILYEIIEKLEEKASGIKEHISAVIADCSSEAVSHIFNLLHLKVKNIFLGACCPNIVNPVLMEGMTEIYNIKQLTAPEEDLKIIKS